MDRVPDGASDAWNPGQYERFAAEREQPFHDLLALVRPAPGMRVVDLGCGTGGLTRKLHERLGAAETLGLDTSAAMLAKAQAGGGCTFATGDIATFAPERPYDLVFTNAALHWVPDHPALFRRLWAAVAEGGQLAVQVPANFDYPSHTVAAAVAGEEPFASALGGHRHPANVLPPAEYAALLDDLGVRAQHVRLQVYGHHLASRDDVVEWVRGTLLTDYLGKLTPELGERFLARYRERLLPLLPDRRPFFYPFKRLLLWASR